MRVASQTHTGATSPAPSFTPARGGLLQRKCACGGKSSGVRDECDGCSGKPLTLRRQAMSSAETLGVPPVVNEVLNSSGQPLDPKTRAFMEPRFGHNFGNVRVHTDGKAVESARAVNALAYTVGHDIVIGTAQYSAGTASGKRLLAHELAHVVQQGSRPVTPGAGLEIGAVNSVFEREADRVADAVGYEGMPSMARDAAQPGNGTTSPRGSLVEAVRRMATSEGMLQAPHRNVPAVSTLMRTAAPLLQKIDRLPPLPGYSQHGTTCGAASLVSALIIWDRQRSDQAAPNSTVETACNIILTYLSQYRNKTIKGWNDKKLDGAALHELAVNDITAIRDRAQQGGGQITETDYQAIGMTLYLLYVDPKQAGLSSGEIESIQKLLGLSTGKSEGGESFDAIFSSTILRSLQPNQIAQIGWYVKMGKPDAQGSVGLGHHAFLVGRLKDGKWFLSDQGPKPAFELQADSLDALKSTASTASATGSYWIFTGAISDMRVVIIGGWTGVKLLGASGAVDSKAAEMLVKPGAFIAEVDEGSWTTGERLVAGDFVSRHYSLSDAASVGSGSGLIVEMPVGVFNYYRTNLVSDDNLKVTGIDESDSSDGLLARKIFMHAWLRLCSANMCKADLIKVY